MKQSLLIYLVILTGMTSFSDELRIWTFSNGKSVEAEFISVIGDKVALKGKRGKLIKVSKTSISKEDQVYIELSQPPALDFSFSKTTKPFTYMPLTGWFEENNVPPRSQFYTFSSQIKQTSANPYNHELSAEVFVMAVEVDGDKNILIDYRKQTFRLAAEKKRKANIQGAEGLMLTTYLAPGGMWRGEKYAGYLIVVTDSQGEVVGHATTRDWWFEKIENLRKVPVGKTFDKEGNRCWPTRPKESDY